MERFAQSSSTKRASFAGYWDSVRTAGADPYQFVLTATAADVTDVVVGGRRVVTAGQHLLGDVGLLLGDAIRGAGVE